MVTNCAMNPGRRNYIVAIAAAGLCLFSQVVSAVFFEPGVGLGLEYTDNARLTSEDTVDDLITTGYVGGHVFENEGALKYDARALLNKHNYTQDSYPDKRYFNLGASADWEMVKERFNWFLSDNFSQRTINTLDSNTPDNLQDSNIFTFGANVRVPISARHDFSLVPMFRQFYYEVSNTNNKQYSLAANWNYQMFRSSIVGLSFSTRYVDYFEQVIANTRFTNLGFVSSGTQKRSTYAINLGSTNVKRDTGEETSGFAGYLRWATDVSSRSKFSTNISTNLTDTSTAGVSSGGLSGNGDDVQLTTDVVRNSLADMAYIRDDVRVRSRLWLRFNKITYSDSPLDREIRAFGLNASRPITGLLSGGAYANYNHTKQLDSGIIDKRYTVGGNLNYSFSRKIRGLLDLKYRKRDSTSVGRDYDEYSIYASLVYGFGNVGRLTRAGGF